MFESHGPSLKKAREKRGSSTFPLLPVRMPLRTIRVGL